MKERMHSFMALKHHGRLGGLGRLARSKADLVTKAMHTIDGAFGT
jgi:hypothetical protein